MCAAALKQVKWAHHLALNNRHFCITETGS